MQNVAVRIDNGIITFSGSSLEELRFRHRIVAAVNQVCAEADSKLESYHPLAHEHYLGDQVQFRAAEALGEAVGLILMEVGHAELSRLVISTWPTEIAGSFDPESGRLDLNDAVCTVIPSSFRKTADTRIGKSTM